MLVLLIFVIYPMATMSGQCLVAESYGTAGHDSASYTNVVPRQF